MEGSEKNSLLLTINTCLALNSSILSSYRTGNWLTVLYRVVIEQLLKNKNVIIVIIIVVCGDFIINSS